MKELAKELRIGNLLQGDPIQNVNQGIYSDGVFAITGYGISELELGRMWKAEPIPLTEEWLKRLGFEKTKTESCYRHNDLIIDHLFGQWNARFYYDDDYSFYLTVVKFVHQLQNLFYCLCGEELIYKPDEQLP